MRSHLGCRNKSSSCCRILLACEYGIQLSFWIWAMRSSIGLSSSSRVLGERWSPFISFGFHDTLKSFDSVRIPVGSGNRNGTGGGLRGAGFLWSSGGLAGRPVAQFPCAPRFLGFVFGFLFQAAHFLDGLEDQDLIDSGIACLAQPLLGGLNLPAAHGRPCAVAVRGPLVFRAITYGRNCGRFQRRMPFSGAHSTTC